MPFISGSSRKETLQPWLAEGSLPGGFSCNSLSSEQWQLLSLLTHTQHKLQHWGLCLNISDTFLLSGCPGSLGIYILGKTQSSLDMVLDIWLQAAPFEQGPLDEMISTVPSTPSHSVMASFHILANPEKNQLPWAPTLLIPAAQPVCLAWSPSPTLSHSVAMQSLNLRLALQEAKVLAIITEIGRGFRNLQTQLVDSFPLRGKKSVFQEIGKMTQSYNGCCWWEKPVAGLWIVRQY